LTTVSFFKEFQLNLEVTQNPNPDDLKTISLGLQLHNAKFIGDVAVEDEFKFAVFVKMMQEKLLGELEPLPFGIG